MRSERLKAALRNLVREPRIDYLALYPATVLKDHGDMTLDLQADDERLPPMVRVPLRTFLPGVYVKVAPSSRVLVGFEGGDPSRPVAYLWEAGGLVIVEVATEDGYALRLDKEAREAFLKTPAGRTVLMSDASGKTRVQDPALIEVDAPQVLLAGGGPPVARVGDQIQISGVQPGAATLVGTIISGSPKVKSG